MESPLVRISRAQSRAMKKLRFSDPVTHVYDPLDYARAPWEAYCERFGAGPREVLLIGMNPGPFGMAQTGVPFGDVSMVRDFLGIEEPVRRPKKEHPKRRIVGFACERTEVSGTRLWGWIRDRFETPEAFFERFFITNWCPLVFMEDTGRNRTPDKIKKEERDPLEAICDKALRRTVQALSPRHVVGVGAFAEKRARIALEGLDVQIGSILHPSPASPKANQGWEKQVEGDFARLEIALPKKRAKGSALPKKRETDAVFEAS
jgi:single-strand selective monofunctional uracil DNA glycosylase